MAGEIVAVKECVNLEVPRHEIGGVEFRDVDHVDVEKWFSGIDFLCNYSHGWKKKIFEKDAAGDEDEIRVIERLLIPCKITYLLE